MVSDNSVVISKENAPVFRADTFIINNNLDDTIFAWGGLADGASVGVVSPTKFKISAIENERTQFEGGSDGLGAEFDFTVTRDGIMSQTATIDYKVDLEKSSLTADDFEGSVVPSGTIVFAPNETSKTLSIRINNDTVKETKESFDIKLVDELKTAQLFDDESFVSFVVLNDDPTNPQLNYFRWSSSASSGFRF